jgi:hypothetical protein
MSDPKISSSIPSNLRTTEMNSVEISPELEVPPEVPIQEEPKVPARTEGQMKNAGAENRGFMDMRGDFLRRSLDEHLGSRVADDLDPAALTQFRKRFGEGDPKVEGGINLPPGVMQFAGPLAAPDFVKKIAEIKLTDEQKAAKTQLEQSPAWKHLSDAQKFQVTKNLSKVSGQKLTDEVNKTTERFKAIETLSGRGAWNQLSPAQQEKIADRALKLSGNQLKTETTNIGGKFDAIEKMSQHSAWGVFNPDQKAKLTDPVLNQTGDKLKAHITQTKDRMDALESFSKQPSWKSLPATQQQTVADHILKTKPENLKQTTQNVQQTIDFVASLKNNKVDDQKTLDNLLKYEGQNPKAFPKMAANFTEATNQMDAATDKKKAGEDIRDMMNFSLDRTVGSKKGADLYAEKADIAGRFLRQYKKDPADYRKFRDQLNATPNAKLVAHWHHKDMIGIGIHGTKPVTDSDLAKAKIPAGEETRYKHAIGNLLEREGKYDDMNAYDDGIISIGFRQWTTHQGSMVEPLEAFQKANPTKFKEMLPGITITKNPNTVSYNGKSLTLPPGSKDVKPLLNNLTQSEYMELSTMFNKLGKDPDFQTAQLQVGVNRLNTVVAMPVGKHKIGDYIKSDRALGQVYSFDPGRPGFTNKSFSNGVKDVASEFGLTADAPSRQELLDQLKLKIEGDKAKKIEPDKDFIEKLEKKYPEFAGKLKTDSGRAEFLEKRLTLAFRDRFLEANLKQFGAKDTQRFRDRFEATEKYYNKL